MKFLGILRASALFILVSAFHGPGGVFCSNLEWDPSNESFTVEVSEDHEDSTVESSSELSSPAPKSNLVFQRPSWNDSHLASSVLFLEQFCRDVISKKFNGKLSEAEYDDVSRVCVYLSFKLESVTNHFAPTYGPGTVTERKEIPKNFYEDVLKPEKFDVYAIWLEKNIQNITESYKKMLEESVELTATELKTETSMGPLKYGFVYNGYWWGEIVYWLPPEVYADTGFLEALNELKTSLDKIPKSPVETSTVDYQINEDDVEEPFSADVSEKYGNLYGNPVEPQVVEDAIEESSKVNESDIAENLKESTVEPQVAEKSKDSTVESSSQESLPSSQSNLVFESSEWDDSQLASAFLFIEEFCSLVNAENFGGNLKVLNDVKDNKDAQWFSVKVKSLCSNFSSRLESLSANLVPSGVTVNPYEGVLKSDNFNTYAEWLVKNIPGIRESVQKMFNESKKLNKAQLKTETSMGPLKYGFEFVGDKWKPFVYYNLKDLTWCLRATLEYLQETLDKILKDPQCENASITKKILNFFSREKKSDVNSQQENSTVESHTV